MSKTYYGVEYVYGKDALNDGMRADSVVLFCGPDALLKRFQWVQAGPADFTAAGYREAVGSGHPLVRRYLRRRRWFK